MAELRHSSSAPAPSQPRYTPEEIARMDAEDRQFDDPDIDWEEIVRTTEPDRLAGRWMTFEEWDRHSREYAERIERMTPEELRAECTRHGDDPNFADI